MSSADSYEYLIRSIEIGGKVGFPVFSEQKMEVLKVPISPWEEKL